MSELKASEVTCPLIILDVEAINAIALAVASSLNDSCEITNREANFFELMRKNSELMRHNFLLLKFLYNLMEHRITEIKKGGQSEINGRLLLAFNDVFPDFFTEVLRKVELWKKDFQTFCLSKSMKKKAIANQFEIFGRNWTELNDKFEATFKSETT